MAVIIINLLETNLQTRSTKLKMAISWLFQNFNYLLLLIVIYYFSIKVSSSYHLSVECFSQLSWFRSVYKISSCCWFCIHFWIKWELWKTFDAKMIGWTHFTAILVFVRFLEEIEDIKKPFRNYLTFSAGKWTKNELSKRIFYVEDYLNLLLIFILECQFRRKTYWQLLTFL